MTKHDAGVSSVHWQYLEDMSKVTPHITPLRLAKEIYIREDEKGSIAQAARPRSQAGRRTRCALSFANRPRHGICPPEGSAGSGTEPVNVLSHYKYQDGLAYYESTRDASATSLSTTCPRALMLRVPGEGVPPRPLPDRYREHPEHVPEFNSHSASHWLEVK